ncbi:MAG: hypothetical protein FJZ01_25810, partial [Candidatus Sericytochromatia bacterium]|nr:hypothetical protein [Candidatus Tanganyikabacteria bacterium]
MRFSPLYWRLLLTTLAGTAAACNQAPPLVGQVAAQADSASDVLGMLPASLPAADADRTLVPVAAEAIATSFRPDKFTGEPGSYRGFAPGFTAEIIARSRFLRFADFLFPYGASEGRFVPVVFRTQDLYIYPALRVEGAAIVPVFIVRRVL